MTISTFLNPELFKDKNDQISTALNNGSSLNEACASVGLENNNTSLITQQMQTLMQSSLFERTAVGRLGWNGNITHNGQTQCGVYTVATGGRAKVDIDLDGDGVIQDNEKGVDAAQAMAASYDSELDLYIEDSIQKFIQENCGSDTSFWWEGRGFMQPEMQKKLYEEYGIVIEQVGDDRRTYSFSLVDDEGNVIEDANGNKASILWGDWVIPDGFAQGAELNLSSILDSIGYDCVSKADFVFNEELGGEAKFDEMINTLHKDVANVLDLTNSSAYTGEEAKYSRISDTKTSQMYGGTQIISLATGGAISSGNGETVDISQLADLGNIVDELKEETDETKEKDEDKKEKEKVDDVKTDKTENKKEDKTLKTNDLLKDALNDYEEELNKALEENPQADKEEIAKEIAKKYDIDYNDILKNA